jgi:predicted nucleic acid-binding protein
VHSSDRARRVSLRNIAFAKQGEIQQWLSELVGTCRVLSVDARTAEHYAIRAELKKDGRPIPENDIWIAAIASQHAMPVLSRDHHFDAVGGLTRVGW